MLKYNCKFNISDVNRKGNGHMRNLDIRVMVSESGLRYKDIARELGISQQYLSLLMRYDLTPENRERILRAIEALKGIVA